MTYILIGFAGGLLGGTMGLGGGAVMVPLLVYFAGLTQHQAQGTVIGLLTLPVFLAAAWRYYVEGNLRLDITGFMVIGFALGAFLGAHFVQYLPETTLKRIFGIFLILLGIKIVLGK